MSPPAKLPSSRPLDQMGIRFEHVRRSVYPESMTDEELSTRADSWIRYQLAPKKSPARETDFWAVDLYELEYHDPETLWLLILAILQKNSSMWIKAVLSAGPVENLLARFGPQFIDRIEVTARRDPTFAHMLGGVWPSTMKKDVWDRLQRVCRREGWWDAESPVPSVSQPRRARKGRRKRS